MSLSYICLNAFSTKRLFREINTWMRSLSEIMYHFFLTFTSTFVGFRVFATFSLTSYTLVHVRCMTDTLCALENSYHPMWRFAFCAKSPYDVCLTKYMFWEGESVCMILYSLVTMFVPNIRSKSNDVTENKGENIISTLVRASMSCRQFHFITHRNRDYYLFVFANSSKISSFSLTLSISDAVHMYTRVCNCQWHSDWSQASSSSSIVKSASKRKWESLGV